MGGGNIPSWLWGLYLSFINKVSFGVFKFLLGDPSVSPTSSLREVTEDFPGPYLVFLGLELRDQEAKGPCCATSAADPKTKELLDPRQLFTVAFSVICHCVARKRKSSSFEDSRKQKAQPSVKPQASRSWL